MADERLHALWHQICQEVKKDEMNLPLWRALDAAVPIQLDGTTLVIGYDVKHQHEASALAQPAANAQLVSRVMSTIATRPLHLLAIDGTLPADYLHYKERQVASEQMAQQRREALAQDATRSSAIAGGHESTLNSSRLLSDLHRLLHARYIDTPHHNQTLVKAAFLLEVLPDVLACERQLAQVESDPEHLLRLLSRALDKIAGFIEVPPITMAMAYMRFKQRGGKPGDI